MKNLNLVTFLLFIVFVIDLCIAITLGNEPLSINLRYVSRPAFQISRDLSKKPLCIINNVEFYLTLNPFFWPADAFVLRLRGRQNRAYLTPSTLLSKNFKAIAAHELGHIQKNTYDQYEADAFAVKLLGNKQEMVDMLRTYLNHDDSRITALLK